MSAIANFAGTPTVGAAVLTTGDTSRSAPTAGGETIFAPGANGGLCERISFVPLATTVDSVLRVFRYDGADAHLYAEFPLSAQTVTGGAVVQSLVLSAVTNPELFPITVPETWTLTATVNDTQTGVKAQAEGGAF